LRGYGSRCLGRCLSKVDARWPAGLLLAVALFIAGWHRHSSIPHSSTPRAPCSRVPHFLLLGGPFPLGSCLVLVHRLFVPSEVLSVRAASLLLLLLLLLLLFLHLLLLFSNRSRSFFMQDPCFISTRLEQLAPNRFLELEVAVEACSYVNLFKPSIFLVMAPAHSSPRSTRHKATAPWSWSRNQTPKWNLQ